MEIVTFFVLLGLGFWIGGATERKHLADLQTRERAIEIPVRADKLGLETVEEGTLVQGSVVMGHDYFKSTLSTLQGLVGGSLGAYEALLDRARREAILRMMEKAQSMGAHEVVCLRIENFPVTKGGAVEVFAYGTAVKHQALRSEARSQRQSAPRLASVLGEEPNPRIPDASGVPRSVSHGPGQGDS